MIFCLSLTPLAVPNASGLAAEIKAARVVNDLLTPTPALDQPLFQSVLRVVFLQMLRRTLLFHRMNDVTQILDSIQHGDLKAAEELLPLVYQELRKLAAQKMAHEAEGHTLQPTALVHEAWLRLVGGHAAEQWNSRGHFFGAAAEAMRRILIERARSKARLRRGGGQKPLNLDDVSVAAETAPDELLAVNEALEKLEAEDAEKAQLVKLRFFAGMTNDEAAATLGISVTTAKRYWTFARAWLYNEIKSKT